MYEKEIVASRKEFKKIFIRDKKHLLFFLGKWQTVC